MSRILHLCASVIGFFLWGSCVAAESITIRDTYVWEEFTVTKAKPKSADGRFSLKHVSWTGSVELSGYFESEEREIRVVKSLEKSLKAGGGLPWIVVKESSWRKQSATIRVLKVKCETEPNKPPQHNAGSGPAALDGASPLGPALSSGITASTSAKPAADRRPQSPRG
jgi:hypothetical protein